VHVTDVVGLTQALIQIPTENPPGDEAAGIAFVEAWALQAGLSCKRVPVISGRDNLLIRLGPPKVGPPVVWLAHIDTVPAETHTRAEAFSGEVRDGRLYGRGAADMKGGLAAGLVAMANLRKAGIQPQRELILAVTVDEEGEGLLGARALTRTGLLSPESWLLALEPTSLQLALAHKGEIWFDVTTRGRAAHAGRAYLGIDAIHGMAMAIDQLKTIVSQLPEDHPTLGRALISAGWIQGGTSPSMVADRCQAHLDLVLVPPQTTAFGIQLVQQTLQSAAVRLPGLTAEARVMGEPLQPVECDADSPLISWFHKAYLEATGSPPPAIGFEAYTDAAVIATELGIPHSAVFGPGNLAQAHSADEYVAIEQLTAAVGILEGLGRGLV
jgi:succinyl-diaminopimelate desuccinylase